MYKVFIRPLARNDIKMIWRYTFKQWGEKQADFYTTELGYSIEALVDNPKLGNPIDHIREGYRLYHFQHHLAIYRLTQSTIDVVRILSETMDIGRHL